MKNAPASIFLPVFIALTFWCGIGTVQAAEINKYVTRQDCLDADQAYAVQADVFETEAEARTVVASLRKHGLSPYIFSARLKNGRTGHAVRVDLHPSLDAALKKALELKKKERIMFHIAPSGSIEGVEVSKIIFFAQVGAFQSEKNSRALAEDLKKSGYTAANVPMCSSQGKTWHIVFLGPYDTLEQTEKMMRDYQEREQKSAYINAVEKDFLLESLEQQKP